MFPDKNNMPKSYDQVLRDGRRILEEHKQRQAVLRKIRMNNFFRNGFGVIFLVLLIGGLGYFGYTKKDAIFAAVQKEVAKVLKVEPKSNPGTTTTTTTTTCGSIIINPATSTTKATISAVSIGNCYNIAEADRAFWKQVFTDGGQVSKYAEHIFVESSDQSLSKDEVAAAITKSLSTNVLDLRKNQPAPTEAPAATQAPTEAKVEPTATEAATSTPAPTETPASVVTVVSFPEKEMQLSLDDLVAKMRSHNIPAVASNNNAKDIHDRVNWQMWYETGSGKDYLIFSILNSNLPPSCANGTFISVSLEKTGTEGEVAVKSGDTQVWLVCK